MHIPTLEKMLPYMEGRPNAEYFDRPPGEEHYCLLGHLSRSLAPGSVAVDIGTYWGHSALALAVNPDVRVVTFDLVSRELGRMPPNVDVVVGDVTSPEHADLLRRAALVVLDVDPHDGVQESQIYQHLKDVGFRGTLVCDDIRLNNGMRGFWAGIRGGRDVTQHGHCTGTGLVDFSARGYKLCLVNRTSE